MQNRRVFYATLQCDFNRSITNNSSEKQIEKSFSPAAFCPTLKRQRDSAPQLIASTIRQKDQASLNQRKHHRYETPQNQLTKKRFSSGANPTATSNSNSMINAHQYQQSTINTSASIKPSLLSRLNKNRPPLPKARKSLFQVTDESTVDRKLATAGKNDTSSGDKMRMTHATNFTDNMQTKWY